MGNMSYCRFENTANDLKECVWALNDEDYSMPNRQGDLGQYEIIGLKDLLDYAQDIVHMEDYIKDIVRNG
tara:strand:- start:264 stop:473 length:210 start_codon:yes stop_codon:yes gene_type:complete